MYINGKMRLIETIPGMVGEGIKENDEGGKLNSDIFDIGIFVNATMCPQHNNKNILSKLKKRAQFLKVLNKSNCSESAQLFLELSHPYWVFIEHIGMLSLVAVICSLCTCNSH
jgi:hypothetical protein